MYNRPVAGIFVCVLGKGGGGGWGCVSQEPERNNFKMLESYAMEVAKTQGQSLKPN